MGRMLDALKALDTRTPVDAPAPSLDQASPPQQSPAAELPEDPPASVDPPTTFGNWDKLLDDTTTLVDDAIEMFGLPPLAQDDPLDVAPPPTNVASAPRLPATPPQRPAQRRPALQTPSFENCTLPIAGDPADYYLEAAARICDQGSNNYSNVLLFVSADRGSEACFSMPDLAHAFALRLAGDVLLIDGDLREGRLSRQVSRPGAGMVEAMLGQAQWPDLIHPTNIARIDFVARGSGQVPTFERPQFGWSALRPLYRAVLIGPANQAEPETLWLAARCDAVYFILSRLHTRRSNATAAVNALRAGGANVAGCIVVND
jgi:Mrp family chromosome partitioning ATPase